VAQLDVQLASAEGRAAREVIRGLVERIVVQPGSAATGQAPANTTAWHAIRDARFRSKASKGDGRSLNAQKPLSGGTGAEAGAVVILLVAGVGFEPTTFRL
jgi:hypothetical protein